MQIYVFLYGPIEDLFIKSRGHNLDLTMIIACAYGLTVACNYKHKNTFMLVSSENSIHASHNLITGPT